MTSNLAIGTVTLLTAFSFITSILYEPQSEFKTYTTSFAKHYHGDQYVYRYNIFKQSQERVKQHNQRAQKGQQSYFLGINAFSDMPIWQFSQKYLQNELNVVNQQSNFACAGSQPVVKDIPDNFDWSNRSAVTPVRKVSACGKAAYAIVTAETIESGRFITTGRLSQASPQQIIDCSNGTGNKGCTSGNILNSFQYILKSGITGQTKYPFTDKSDACAYHISQKQWQILGCVKVTPQNQTLIRAAVVRQPIAASVNATLAKFKDYQSGVFQITGAFAGCKSNPSHWVTIVGFGIDTDAKKKYWRLKNSWGTSWGLKGYMHIVRSGDGQGECGIQNEIFYPLD